MSALQLHEQMAQKQERLEAARERRFLHLAEHEERLRRAVARSAKDDDGRAIAFALGRPMVRNLPTNRALVVATCLHGL